MVARQGSYLAASTRSRSTSARIRSLFHGASAELGRKCLARTPPQIDNLDEFGILIALYDEGLERIGVAEATRADAPCPR
jgi:hypothetical protein